MSDTHAAPAHGATAHDATHGAHHHELPWLRKYVFSTDHKVIGLQYMFSCLFTLMVGGLLALMVRWQVAYPTGATMTDAQKQEYVAKGIDPATVNVDKPIPVLGHLLWGTPDDPTTPDEDEHEAGVFDDNGGQMPDAWYPVAFTMHASMMIFLVIIPMLTGFFGNFVIPLQIGAKDMAFPFLNGLSFWT